MNSPRKMILVFLVLLGTATLAFGDGAPLAAPSAIPSAAPSAAPTVTPPSILSHAPYALKKCDACHLMNPDGTPIKNKFKDTQPNLCYQCHDRVDKEKHKHPALEAGDCTMMCHSPHQSKFPALLQDTITNTCTGCHDAPGQDEQVRHGALDMKKACIRCHNPHSSKEKKLLRAPTPDLCVYCHKDMGTQLDNPDNTIHPAIYMGCQNCHEPHGSPNAKLFKKPLNDLCFQCHDKDAFASGHPRPGHIQFGPHDPLYPEKPFTCISCHKPHYSANEKLLRYHFKAGVTPYDGSICSVCHWQNMLPTAPPRPKWDD